MFNCNVFVIPSNDNSDIEKVLNTLKTTSTSNVQSDSGLKPTHQYIKPNEKEYIDKILDHEEVIFHYDTLYKNLKTHTNKNPMHHVLSAYLRHKGFTSFKMKTTKNKKLVTLWKHKNNIKC